MVLSTLGSALKSKPHPMSFCQLGYYSRNDCPEDLDKIEIRIWSCSYTELRGLYHSGLLEKSDELQEFRKWIEDLPYCEWIMTPYWI